jgi:predicted ATPase
VRQLPSGSVTLLFTDIEGSTRLVHELGERYQELLAEHRRVLREAFASHGGVEVDTQGDAFFVAFQRAQDAVVAAEEAQRALAEGPVRVRIGIHTGNPTLGDEGYVGMDVHRGARIAAAGHGGQVLLSQATRELLDEEFELCDVGEHRLKDLDEAEWLFQLGPREFPPLKSLNNTNLPAPAYPLVGRERELSDLSELLRGDDVRLLTVSGAGGTGKTRLALELAADSVSDYPNGVFFVSLAPISDASLVLPTIAQTLGLKEQAREPLLETLARELEPRRMLLFLDNLEQVLEAASELAQLLERAPQLKLLVTSRESLHLGSEHEYVLPPLSEPEAVELFRARAANSQPAAAVAEICRRLDRLPLAIELAAARTKLLPPQKLLQRLEQRLPLLTSKRRDLPARQQTLRATIAWSYDLLSPEEQKLFAHLAVFVGGCTLEAAEDVCDAELETLESLIDKSLLRRREGPDCEPRFWMLETIREFALERLEGGRENEQAHGHHADYFCAMAERQNEAVREMEPTAIESVEADMQNYRAAVAWSIDSGHKERGARLLWALWFFWLLRGHAREADGSGKAILALPGTMPPGTQARAVIAASELARFRGDLPRAIALKHEAVSLFRRLGEDERVAPALADLASMAALQGEYECARALANEAMALRRRLPERWGVAHALGPLVEIELRQGNLEAAAKLAEEALGIWRESGFSDAIADSLLVLGEIRRRLGQTAPAREALSEGMRLLHRNRDELRIGDALTSFGCLAAAEGDPRRAALLWGAADEAAKRVGIELSYLDDPPSLLRRVRADLGDEGLTHAMAEGRELSFEKAVEVTLQP